MGYWSHRDHFYFLSRHTADCGSRRLVGRSFFSCLRHGQPDIRLLWMKRGGRRNFYDDRSCYWRCPFCLCLYFSDSNYNSCPDPMTPSTISLPSLAIPPESSVQKHGQPSDFSFASASGTNTFAKLSIVGLSTLTPFPNGAAAVTTTAAATI